MMNEELARLRRADVELAARRYRVTGVLRSGRRLARAQSRADRAARRVRRARLAVGVAAESSAPGRW